MKKFFSKLFKIPGVRLPGIHLKAPDWKTPNLFLRLPRVGSFQMNIRVPSIRGLKIVGGVYKVGTLGIVMAAIVGGFAIGTSVVFTRAEPHFPEPGVYSVAAVPLDNTLKVGDRWEFDEYITPEDREIKSNTLLINMSGARAGNIAISGLDIGAAWSASTDAIKIIGASGKVLECEKVIFDNVSATQITIAASQFYKFNLINNTVSGMSVGGTLSSTPTDIVVRSERNVVKLPAVSNGTFDKIEINTATASSQCATLSISDVHGFGGGISIANLHAGEFTIQNSRFGKDGDIDTTFELTVGADVLYSQGTFTGNVEGPVVIK